MIVELEVCGLFWLSRPEIQIWFIPNLKVPAGDFLDSIAIREMLRKIRDKIVPLGPILRRGHIRAIPERMKAFLRGKFFGHETHFNERANTV